MGLFLIPDALGCAGFRCAQLSSSAARDLGLKRDKFIRLQDTPGNPKFKAKIQNKLPTASAKGKTGRESHRRTLGSGTV
jgi:hypothetical protein